MPGTGRPGSRAGGMQGVGGKSNEPTQLAFYSGHSVCVCNVENGECVGTRL